MNAKRLLVTCAPVLAVLLVGVPAASGLGLTPAGPCLASATKTWDGGAGTSSWNDAANWAPDGVPGPNDLVCIPRATGGTVAYTTGTTSIASLEGDGPLQISGGTLNITSRSRSSRLLSLTLTGGTLGGSADLVVPAGGQVLWTGGTITSIETNPGTLTVSGPSGTKPAASLAIAPSSSVTLGGSRVVRNQGTTRWTSGDVHAQLTASGHSATTFDNQGTFTIENSSDPAFQFDVSGNAVTYPRFVNEAGGTVTQTADSAGGSWITTSTENDGAVAVDGGLLMMGGYNASPPVDSGSYTAAPGTTLYVAGRRTIAGSIDAPSATVELSQTTITGSYAADTTKIFDDSELDSEPSVMRDVQIESDATLNLNVDQVVIHDVLLNYETAVLGGRANIVIPAGGSVECLDGAIGTDQQSPGTLTLAGPDGGMPGAVYDVHGYCGLNDGRRLVNDGTLHLFTNDDLVLRGTSPFPQIDNHGAVVLDGGMIFQGSVENEPNATVESTSTGQIGAGIESQFENDGTVNVQTGSFLAGYYAAPPQADSGNYLASPGTILTFAEPRTVDGDVLGNGADLWMDGGQVFEGRLEAGSVSTQGSPVTFDNPDTTMSSLSAGGIVNVNVPVTLDELVGGIQSTIGGSGDVTLAPGGVGTWDGGTFTTDPAASARLIVSAASGGAPAARLTVGRATFSQGRVLENHGIVDLVGGEVALNGTGTEIDNYADIRYITRGDYQAYISGQGSATFHNFAAGHVVDAVASGSFGIGVSFVNDGSFEAEAGTLDIYGPSSAVNSGSFAADAGATLELESPGMTLGPGASVVAEGTANVSGGSLLVPGGAQVSGAGTFLVSGGSATIGGSFGPSTTQVTGGVLALNSTAVTARLVLSGGVLGGTGTLELQGQGSSWTAGRMADAGTTRVASSADLAISGSGTKVIAGGRTLENEGSIAWAGTSVGSDEGATILNDSGGTVDMQGNSQMYVVSGARAELTNAAGAVLRKSGGNTEALFDADFENDGSADFAAASIHFASPTGVVNSGTMTVEAGATVGSTGAIDNEGVLDGDGTIAANVVSPGEVRPGDSPGILTVSGACTQQPAGRLRVDIAGTDPGTGYDRLVVTGGTALDGTLTIETAPGFDPPLGTTFEIVDGSRSGEFSSVEGADLPGGLVYHVYYDDADVRLVVEQSSPPSPSQG